MSVNNAWDLATNLADKHANQSGMFIRLTQNGDKVIGAFVGEPFAREVVWTGERYEAFDPSVHKDKRPSLRVMLNFFVPEENEMKVIEGGTAWFKDLLKVRDKYGLDKWLFEVQRNGDAGDPKTKYSILPEVQIDAEMQARIDAAGTHDLASIGSGDGKGQGGSGPAPKAASADTARAAAAQATAMVTRLQALPNADLQAFLTKFGVQRVRDIPDTQRGAAEAFLSQLEAARNAAVTANDDFIDPFA